jgi:hypothetical protein
LGGGGDFFLGGGGVVAVEEEEGELVLFVSRLLGVDAGDEDGEEAEEGEVESPEVLLLEVEEDEDWARAHAGLAGFCICPLMPPSTTRE